MNDFIYRLILSALSLMLFYGIYRILLNKLALLNAGRAYLLITMIMALLLPLPWQRLMESPAEIAFVVNLDVATIIPYAIQAESAGAFNWWNLVFYIYLMPVAIFSLFFLYSNLRLLYVLRQGQRINKHLVLLDHDLLPFSWFGRIVMSRKDYESPYVQSIIAHELTHIRQYHFVDLLLAELLVMLQWFNPAAWAYRYALRDVHEYLADRGSLLQSGNITTYQKLLLSLSGSITAGLLSNNIKHSTLKNRFTMMTKTNNRKPAFYRLTLAFVAMLFTGWTILGFAMQNLHPANDAQFENLTASEFTSISQASQPDTTKNQPQEVMIKIPENVEPDEELFVVVENPPTFPGGDEARMKYLVENINYPDEARKKGIQGVVFVTFVVERDGSINEVRVLRGIGGGCDEEAKRVIENMPNWTPGTQRGKPVRVVFNMPIRFTLAKDKE
jgi:TonB family protein